MIEQTYMFSSDDASYQRVPTVSDGAAIPGSTLFNSVYSSLGAWMGSHSVQPATEPPDKSEDRSVDDRAQTIIQALEDMGTRALQAAALNVCLPANGWLKSGSASRCSSRCGSLSPPAQHPMRPPSNATSRRSAEYDLAVGSPVKDTRKSLGQAEGHKPVSSSTNADQQPARRKVAAGTADTVAELMAKNDQLHRELSCCRVSLAAMYLVCSRLRQENQHLSRVSDCSSEELLSDALEQLLGEKNLLQQEVVRLKQQNTALQELLEYTAPTAAPPATDSATSWSLGQCGRYAGSSGSLAATTATPAEIDVAVDSRHDACSHQAASEAHVVSHPQYADPSLLEQLGGQHHHQQHCQQQRFEQPVPAVCRLSPAACSVSGSEGRGVAQDLDDWWQEEAAPEAAASTAANADHLNTIAMPSRGPSLVDMPTQSSCLQQDAQQRWDCPSVGVDSALLEAVHDSSRSSWKQQQQQHDNSAFYADQQLAVTNKATQLCRQVGKQQQLKLDADRSRMAQTQVLQ